jgi:hypothetical protein
VSNLEPVQARAARAELAVAIARINTQRIEA